MWRYAVLILRYAVLILRYTFLMLRHTVLIVEIYCSYVEIYCSNIEIYMLRYTVLHVIVILILPSTAAGLASIPAFSMDILQVESYLTYFTFTFIPYLLYFYFFLPLVPIGVAGGHSCLSAARRVAWRRDIP